jgi:hypothetical protein
MLDEAILALPPAKLVDLARRYLGPAVLEPEKKARGTLLAAVQEFERASLKGEYHESFNVNSRNYDRKSPGTSSWLAECERLFNRCAARAGTGSPQEVARSFDILLRLLDHVDEGEDDVVFFADEGGSWQVDVDWEKVLPAWFTVLSATAKPEEYARRVVEVIDSHCRYHRKPLLAVARRRASAEQRRLLPKA